jgi:CBS domain-containing protein
MRKPLTIGIMASIQEVAKIMKENRIGSVIVTDDKGIAGIVTQRDFIEKLLAEGKNLKDLKITNIMSQPVALIQAEEDVSKAFEFMKILKVRRLAVMDDSELVGIITTNDIVNNMVEYVNIIAETFQIMAPRPLE